MSIGADAGLDLISAALGALLRRLDRARALLDLVGWAESGPPAAVRVDLGKHWWALLGALEIALLAGSDEVQEAEKLDAERAQRGEAPKRDATLVRVLAVREFISAVEGLTLREIGERFGIGAERVRQLLTYYFRLKGVPSAVKARREMRRDGDPMT